MRATKSHKHRLAAFPERPIICVDKKASILLFPAALSKHFKSIKSGEKGPGIHCRFLVVLYNPSIRLIVLLFTLGATQPSPACGQTAGDFP